MSRRAGDRRPREAFLSAPSAVLRGAPRFIVRPQFIVKGKGRGKGTGKGRERHGGRSRLVALGAAADDVTMTSPKQKAPREFHPALRVVMMPRDANQYGSIFGGVILSYIDQSGFIEARKHGNHRWVTASIETVNFHAPVEVGDVVNFLTATERTGTTSVRVRVRVEAERYATEELAAVTEATLTMVAVDGEGHPIPFRSPPSVEPPRRGVRS